MRSSPNALVALALLAAAGILAPSSAARSSSLRAGELRFEQEELATRLEVGYAVRVLDMNADEKPDIAIVDSKRFLWLENPSWKEHVIHAEPGARFDNVSFAPSDIDGDGTPDFAVGRDWQFGNTESGGTIGWISSKGAKDGAWPYVQFDQEPTTHRMNFADIDGDGEDELLVVPLKGRETTGPDFAENPVRVLAYEVPDDPVDTKAWKRQVIDETTHVTHNFWPADIDGDGSLEILLASFEGVSVLEREKSGEWKRRRIGAGEQERGSNRGASEIRSGALGEGRPFLATIEPWHGDEVVVYTPPTESASAEPASAKPANAKPANAESGEEDGAEKLWTRHVLDTDLKWGHAVACADLDGDGADELVIGVRDDKSPEWRRGLRIYRADDAKGAKWTRHFVDPGGVAIEDLAVADLDEDGKPDVVAVGRQTHNVKIYWNRSR